MRLSVLALLVGLYCISPQLRAQTELYHTPLYNDPSLVAYYRLEGNANDSSQNANNGTYSNLVFGTPYGKFGQGATFDGLNSNIVPTSPISLLSGNFTLSFWLYQSAAPTFDQVILETAQDTYLNRYHGYEFMVDIGQTVRVAVDGGDTGTGTTFIGTGTYTLNAWHLIDVTYDGVTMKAYIDGLLTDSASIPPSAAPSYGDSSIGAWFNNAYSSNFAGDLDDVAIFSRPLTATEVSNLYTGYWNACTTTTLVCGCQQDTYKAVPSDYNGSKINVACAGRGPFGLEYECPEYVNRFYSQAKAVNTSTWLHTNGGQYYSKAAEFGLVAYPNCTNYPDCASNTLPQPDDIVSFCNFDQATGSCTAGAGHVAIVKKVTTKGSRSTVTFIEQNYSPSAKIDLTVAVTENLDGTFTMADRNNGKLRAWGWLRLP